MDFYHFFHFFANFFGIFYYASSGNETERQFLFSLFLGLFQPILAWDEATMVFFDFLILFSLFLEISITRRVGTKRRDNFYILSFSAFSNLFWLGMKPQRYFLIFYFFSLFLEFSIICRVRTERKDNFYFFSFSAFCNLFWLEMKP